MKLSEKVIELCKKHTNEYKNCMNCPIEKECYEYRQSSIRLYEEFKELFRRLENE